METLPAGENGAVSRKAGSSRASAREEVRDATRPRPRDQAEEEEEELPPDRRSLLNSRLPTVPFARGLRARLGSGVCGVWEYLWEINGNFREASGALGVSRTPFSAALSHPPAPPTLTHSSRLTPHPPTQDLGTFIPLFISLVNVTGLDPTLGLFFNGFANVVTGLSFPIPMPYVSGKARDNPNRKKNETHETVLARARRSAPPPARWAVYNP